MKKNCPNFIIIFLLVFCTGSLIAQTKQERLEIKRAYNQEKIKSLQSKLTQTFAREKEKAYQYAEANNIPTLITAEDGKISILQRISETGDLIYYTTSNLGAAETTKTTSLHHGGSLGLNVEGQNMIVGVWDGGIVRPTHTLLKGRVTQEDNAFMLHDHATHVSGTLIGGGQGEIEARGMAPQAHLWAYDFNNDLPEVVTAAGNGLLISNHSYGFNVEFLNDNTLFGIYTSTARDIDEISFEFPYYLMVVAAGNDRNGGYNVADNGYDLLTGNGVAKNNLTIAAVEGVQEYTGPESVVMSNFSNFGPPDDGRIKPDISAKGVSVYSSLALDDNAYASYDGTSMASPNTTGSLLLLQQLSNNLSGNFLKSATLKAIAINTASEAGENPGPDYRFGWGLLNIETAAKLMRNNNFSSIYEENELAEGDTFEKNINAIEGETLTATLVWTDPKGGGGNFVEDDRTAKLINDLDIRIEDEEGTVYFPWKLDPDNPEAAATQEDNVVDNVEEITIPEASGAYTITINHKDNLEGGSQNYSLVVNGIVVSDFTFIPENLEKEFCASDEAEFNFTYASQEEFTSETTFTTTGLPEGLTAQFSDNSLNENGEVSLTITNLNQVEEGTYNFMVTAENGTTTITKNLTLTIKNADSIENTAIILPENEATDISLYPLLDWTDVDGVLHYNVEIAEDATFNTIVLEEQVENSELQVNGLDEGTTYFWRVQAATECYAGNFEKGQFETLELVCDDNYVSTDVPVTINANLTNDQPEIKSVTVHVDNEFPLEDLKAEVVIEHSYLSDLEVFLTSPAGTQVLLFSELCGNLPSVNAIFSDAGVTPSCEFANPSLTGVIKPSESFNAFQGESTLGDWTLTVIDPFQGDGGAINRFELQFCGEPGLSVDEKQMNAFTIYPNPASTQVTLGLKDNVQGDINVTISDLNGRMIQKNKLNGAKGTQQTINVASLQTGIYFMNIHANGKQETQKLIIK